jgi:catechol 2,3-dioxygenase-like lactoylglutathione lyase family enzyme
MSENRATGIGTLDAVVMDTPDIAASGAFWRELTGGRVEQEADDGGTFLTLQTPDGWSLAFQPAPNLARAQWPGQEYPQQLHLDLRVPDVAAATERAVGLGATVLRENPEWNTLADPAGHPFDLCLAPDNPGLTIMGVTFDVPDAHAAAQFWSGLLGDPVTYDAEGMAMLGGDKPVLFQQVEGYNAPQWPDPQHPQQLHLDLWIGDRGLDAAEAAALDLGATRLPGGGQTFRVFADPAGHPFCLCG